MVGPGALAVVRLAGVYLLGFFCSGVPFCVLLVPCLCFVSLLYLGLCVLGHDAGISGGTFIRTKYMCVLVCVWAGVGLVRHEVGFGPPVGYFY